jgi:phenylpropionate dioxygenase-like ring-hydroxylating dioxygenase large terminal subunit
MLSAAENETLVRTGKGTPGGEYFRRFWMPALLSEEVPVPDCPPVRVKLYGECLVAFRDSSGRVGLVGAYCAHRQVDLFFGRNEQNGLRCLYHGWKYDVDGNCVDIPTDPEGKIKRNVQIASYPCKEYAGIVWAYMGPKELPADVPQLEFNGLPREQVYINKSLLECNWLQAMEGNLDSSHLKFLHSFLVTGGAAPMHEVSSTQTSERDKKRAADAIRSVVPSYEVHETEFGFMLGAKRKLADGQAYWRINQWLLPNHTMVSNAPGQTLLWDAWVPMDDEHTWVYRVEYNPWRPISEVEKFEFENAGLTHLNVQNIPGTYLPVRNRRNDYLIDRALQRSYSFSGIKGSNAQDAAVIENQGPTPIYDRSKEHPVVGDIGIVRARRRLLKVFQDLRDGIEPVPARQGELYRVRPIAVFLDEDGRPFHEGAREHIFF